MIMDILIFFAGVSVGMAIAAVLAWSAMMEDIRPPKHDNDPRTR